MYCSKCGIAYVDGNFCAKCGSPLNNVTPAQQESVTYRNEEQKPVSSKNNSEDPQRLVNVHGVNMPAFAWEMYLDYIHNHLNEDDTRTKISELLNIAEKNGNFFPECYARVGLLYMQLEDYQKSAYYATLARQQNPNQVFAIIILIILAVLSTDTYVNKKTIEDVLFLSNTAIASYFDPEDGVDYCVWIAEPILDFQGMIREEKKLFQACGTSLAKALLRLPWDNVPINDEEEKNKLDKLLRRIRAEANY